MSFVTIEAPAEMLPANAAAATFAFIIEVSFALISIFPPDVAEESSIYALVLLFISFKETLTAIPAVFPTPTEPVIVSIVLLEVAVKLIFPELDIVEPVI